MKEAKDTFSSYHPIINFTFFALAIVFSMFLMHPVFLIISFFSAFAYSVYLGGLKAIKFNLLYMLPMMFFIALFNPIFNHKGMTILVYINDVPITLESVCYGFASAGMFLCVILWFSCYNAVMTSEKFIYLFGKTIPSLSLIFTMTLRFIPNFKKQINKIRNGQKCLGQDISNGNIISKIKHGVKILSVLVSLAFENSIETADSMKCRGYGIKNRTFYSNYKFKSRDFNCLICMLLLAVIIAVGLVTGQNTAAYFPVLSFGEISCVSIIAYFAYFVLLTLPLFVNVLEDIKWYHLRSKI